MGREGAWISPEWTRFQSKKYTILRAYSGFFWELRGILKEGLEMWDVGYPNSDKHRPLQRKMLPTLCCAEVPQARRNDAKNSGGRHYK